MSLGVLDLWVVVGEVGEDLLLHPRRWRSTTAAPVIGCGERAAGGRSDVSCAVLLDASAEAGLPFVRGHGVMFGDYCGSSMPKFGGGSRGERLGVWLVMFGSLADFYFFSSLFFLYILFIFFFKVENKTS